MQEYKILNTTFILLILLLLSYSFFLNHLPSNIQIQSNCKGNPLCKSEGLSRAINSALHLDFKQAHIYNKNYKRVFSFFLIQLILRFIFLLAPKSYVEKYSLYYVDAFFSSIYLVATFYVFLVVW